MFLELFQLFAIGKKYLEPNNAIDWYTYISTILIVLDFRSCEKDERRTVSAFANIAKILQRSACSKNTYMDPSVKL